MGGFLDAVDQTFSTDVNDNAKPNPAAYKDPYEDAARARLLGSIDNYLAKSGAMKYVPPENQPYEWRSDADRAAIRQQEATSGQRDNTNANAAAPSFGQRVDDIPTPSTVGAAAPKISSPTDGIFAQAPIAAAPTGPSSDDDAAFAAALKAKSAGLNPAALNFKSPSALRLASADEQDQARQRAMNYIMGVRG